MPPPPAPPASPPASSLEPQAPEDGATPTRADMAGVFPDSVQVFSRRLPESRYVARSIAVAAHMTIE
ncbi:MAG: hypothetical protein JO089_02605 [Alphaproteobacteria bacterium]|nr:hypothetical protein [Alphaproteobacteria bacterium]